MGKDSSKKSDPPKQKINRPKKYEKYACWIKGQLYPEIINAHSYSEALTKAREKFGEVDQCERLIP